MEVYDIARSDEVFDLIWFMGVFYHLRYPLLALDLLAQRTRRLMMFQTLTMPGDSVYENTADCSIEDRTPLLESGWPKMAFSSIGSPTTRPTGGRPITPGSKRCCVRAACGSRVDQGTRSISARPMPKREGAPALLLSAGRLPPEGPVPAPDITSSIDLPPDPGGRGAMAGLIERNVAGAAEAPRAGASSDRREEKIADAITRFAGA
jgi:hypothetical protein